MTVADEVVGFVVCSVGIIVMVFVNTAMFIVDDDFVIVYEAVGGSSTTIRQRNACRLHCHYRGRRCLTDLDGDIVGDQPGGRLHRGKGYLRHTL